LKKYKQNIKLRELFRQKLEYAEVVPDAGVRTKLMHRVAREEFLNFNAGSLNIYYLGAILATGKLCRFKYFRQTRQNEQFRYGQLH
jgi:hypothetical protein